MNDPTNETPGSPPSSPGCAWRLLQWGMGLILTLVFGVAGIWWLASSRAFQTLVADRLQEKTGVEWTLSRARIQWPCDRVVDELEMRRYQSGASGELHIGKARWGWRPGGRDEIELTRVTAVLVRDENREWKPAFLTHLGALSDPAELDPWIRRWGESRVIIVNEAEIVWKRADTQNPLAEVDGLEWATLPGGVDGRALRYYALLCRLVYREGGLRGERIRREWVAIPDHPYVEILYEFNWASKPLKPDFWSHAQDRLDARSQPIRIECPVSLLPGGVAPTNEVRR